MITTPYEKPRRRSRRLAGRAHFDIVPATSEGQTAALFPHSHRRHRFFSRMRIQTPSKPLQSRQSMSEGATVSHELPGVAAGEHNENE
jgi:hypothetical protein